MSDKLDLWDYAIIVSTIGVCVWYAWVEIDRFLDSVFDVLIGEDDEG